MSFATDDTESLSLSLLYNSLCYVNWWCLFNAPGINHPTARSPLFDSHIKPLNSILFSSVSSTHHHRFKSPTRQGMQTRIRKGGI